MRLVLHLALLSATATTVLAGCDPNQLYLANHTVVGINAAVNPEQSSGTLIVGYDRTFATVIPRSAVNEQNPQALDSMSAMACSSLSVRGLTIKRYTESLATGDAAKKFADGLSQQPKAVKDFFSCFKDKGNSE